MPNMALDGLFVALLLSFGTTVALDPIPRITWEPRDVHLVRFQEPGVSNYSALLLGSGDDTLYIGAREAIFAVNSLNIADKQHEVRWRVTEDKKAKCAEKGKSKETECLNYIRVLQFLNSTVLYVCGTNAFQPTCDHLLLKTFELVGKNEDGKGRCPFDPAQSYTSVMVDGELYSGTSYNFLGSEPIISRNSPQSPLRTEYAIPWLNEPSFVYADVIRKNPNGTDGEDDKIYFFFTEVSVEYEFFGKSMIPRIARVCKGDQGGLRTLQKKWTSFLKARLACSLLENNSLFNVINDVFILRAPDLKEPVFYAVFTPQWNNVGLSAVCAYNMSLVEDVFSKGKYMQSATVEQSHTKWVRYSGEVPKPRPGACINNEAKAANYSSSLNLPDKTLQFVKDHPLMDDSVVPILNRPRLIKRDVNYTQIVVDRIQALDKTVYDVMFISTDRGALHKAVSADSGMHIIEETQLFPGSEPVQTLLLSAEPGKKYIYAGSNAGVVQAPVAFCEKHRTCVDCVLARDPYCAWSPRKASCVDIFKERGSISSLIQKMSGDASSCTGTDDQGRENTLRHFFKHGGTAELKCSQKSNLARVVWKFQNSVLEVQSPKYRLLGKALLIFNLSEGDSGVYQCLSEERNFSQLVAKHVLEVKRVPHSTPVSPALTAAHAEASPPIPFPPPGTSFLSCVGTGSPASTSTQLDAGSGTGSPAVLVLPPFLSDQSQHVNVHGSFHLFCQATGPSDVHVLWEKNGQKIDVCVSVQTHLLPDGKVYYFSWVKDTLRESSEYCCSFLSKTGNKTSKARITVDRQEATRQESWTRELSNWKSAVHEHDQMMQNWRKAWESCTEDNY
ncbi:semaphorin-4D isoform X3 [Monodelphis domestica]|uniref:semaphorin-4D isoform X3 n=1 Tax=Monodelphis domestica TaxID=13616 RepID=UPI0024E1DD71|nr:semaphorin-4D isoform X3 [Monodelphis domestica]XP_056660500.1 semaphorin-4D isoform X3 [Monodelphis domestica]XP_056660501.1 semaphorin-4D isoform X3 [Monodelphis domestica]